MLKWILNLKLREKFLLVPLCIMVITILGQTVVCYFYLSAQSREKIAAFKAAETEKNKKIIKSQVDVAYGIVERHHANASNISFMINRYGDNLTAVVDIAENVIRDNMARLKRGELPSLEAAKQASLHIIKTMRFNQGGYVWINNTGTPYPRMIMHPLMPSLDGKVMDDPKYNRAYGKEKNMFQAFVTACRENGEGYVDYMWPKPGEGDRPSRKISYVRRIDEWQWIIGTGVYTDDLEKDAMQESVSALRNIRYAEGAGYIWINDADLPHPRLVLYPPMPEWEGKIADDPRFTRSVNGASGNAFAAMVGICKENNGGGYAEYQWPKPTPSGMTQDRPKLSYVRLFEPWGWVIGAGIYPEIDHLVSRRQQDMERDMKNLILLVTLVSVGVAALIIMGVLVFAGYFLKPIQEMKEVADNVSKGDLTRRVRILSTDEFGEISGHFNAIILNFIALVRKLKTDAHILSEAIHNLSSSSAQISSTSNEQAAAVKEIVSTMEDSDELSKTVAARISEVAKAANSAKDMVSQGFSIIKETLEKMDGIKKANAEHIKVIESLGDKIESIWEIVNIINGIAGQTRIIAFNAELEASAAGEAGKNFQIVATEIRRLADGTVSSTSEIKAKINEIQQSSDNLIAASEQGTGKIMEGWEMTRNLERVFEDILASSESSAASADHIAVSIRQQASAFEQILLTLKQISEGIDNFVVSTKSSTHASHNLNDMADSLNQLVDAYVTPEVESPETDRTPEEHDPENR